MTITAVDPYRSHTGAKSRYFLYELNPLSKVFATLPSIIAVLFTRDIFAPLALAILGLVIVLIGARLQVRALLFLFLGLPAFVLVLSLSFGVWTDPALVSDTPVLFRIGDFAFYLGAFETGLATALRLGTLVALALISGFTTTGPDLVRSSVQHLHVPYRLGYTTLAAYRFVPRFRYELDVIRQAHRVRGMAGGRGPFSAIRRGFGYVIPLLAGAIRHAEHMALAMDSRAFGAFRTRTERNLFPIRRRDFVFAIGFWVASAVIMLVAFSFH